MRLPLVYIIDSLSGLLIARESTEYTHFPILVCKFLYLVRKNEIIFSSFLVRSFIPPQCAHLDSHAFIPNQTDNINADPFLNKLGPIRHYINKRYLAIIYHCKPVASLPQRLGESSGIYRCHSIPVIFGFNFCTTSCSIVHFYNVYCLELYPPFDV